MTLFKRLLIFMLVMMPLAGMAAAMKVGDLTVINSIIATNTITGSNVIDRFNVVWWGADASGVNDSTIAIQNAIDWAGNGNVHIPKGTFLVSNLWINTGYESLSGEGPGVSILKSTNTLPVLVMAAGQNIVQNLSIDGNTRAAYGLYITNGGAEQGTFRNIEVYGAGTGIYSQTNSFSMSFVRCKVINCSTGVNLVASFQNSRMDHCLIYHNTNYQIMLGTVGTMHVGVSIKDTDMESVTDSTNLLVNDVVGLDLGGVYFENHTLLSKDIVVDGTTSIVGVDGMYSNGAGVSTNSIFVVGSTNGVSIKNSFLYNFSGNPIAGGTNLSIENCNLSGTYYPMSFRGTVSVSNLIVAGVPFSPSSGQPASANLTNWSLIPTGSMANVVSTAFLTNWANSISNLSETKQLGSANLTNWSLIPTGAMANVVSTTFLTNWANAVSNLANTKQFGSATLTNLSGTGANTNLFSLSLSNATIKPIVFGGVGSAAGMTNTIGQLYGLEAGTGTSLAPNGSNITIASTLTTVSTNANQFGASVQLTIKNLAFLTNANFFGATNFGDFTNDGKIFSTGTFTNGGAANIAGGVTNWAQTEAKGTLYASSNLWVKAGQGTSNAWVGGRIFIDASTQTTNHSGAAAYTNLFTYTVPGNTLTNTGDELEFYLSGMMRLGLANTNGFKCIYGSQTVFDTGLNTASNCPWSAKVKITRTGLSAQRVEAVVLWNISAAISSAGNGTISGYATNLVAAQANGATNIFVFQGESRVAAALTNDYRVISYWPGLN